MSALIIYYSLNGNTRCIAETIAAELKADLLELKPESDIGTKGLLRYFKGGTQVLKKAEPPLAPLDRNPADYDTLVIGTPVWAGSYAPTLRTFFSKHKPTGKRIALFCCHGGGKGRTLDRMAEALEGNEILGSLDLVEPLKKDSDAKKARAVEWIKGLGL